MVGWVLVITKLGLISWARTKPSKVAAFLSSPTIPTRLQGAPSLAILIATFAAPPALSSLPVTLTTGTGASGEILLLGPVQ